MRRLFIPFSMLALAVTLTIAPVSAQGPQCGLGSHPPCQTPYPATPTPDFGMAITHIATESGGGDKTAGATTAVSMGAQTAGDLLILAVAADNAGTSGVSALTNVTDTAGYTWTQQQLKNQTAGAANDGLTVAIFTTIAGASTPVPTINWSPNVTAKAYIVSAYRGTASSPYDGNAASGSGASYSVGPSTSLASGDLIVGVTANESATAPGTDSDTSNGSWSDPWGAQASGGTGGDATKMSLRLEYKIVTGAGTQTFNGSTGASTDWAAAYVAFTLPAAPASPPFRSKSIHNALVR